MTERQRARLESALLVVVLALGAAYLVSFVRGVGAREDPAEPDARPGMAVPQANVDTRRVGRVEVLNDANISGLARAATDRLRDAGFDVVHFGTESPPWSDSSVVYARTADVEIARSVADVLGIARVVSAPDSTLYLDASAVLGSDWKPPARR